MTTTEFAPPSTSPRLHVRQVRGLAAVTELAEEWQALADADPLATVFQTPAWVLSWWEHLAQGEQPELSTVWDEAGRLVAVAPIARSRRAGLRRLTLLGQGGSLTEYVDVVARPETAAAAVPALLADWHSGPPWDLLTAPNIPADQPLGLAMLELAGAAGRRTVIERHERMYRPLPDSWAAFLASLGRNQRKHLKKFANRLSREEHTVRFTVLEEPAELDRALDRFFALHRLRAQADLGVPHRDRFDTPARRAFLRAVAGRLAARGRLLPCFLEIDGNLVAVQLCFVHGRTLYPFHSGYDPAWAWHGVMLTLFARCIELGIDRGMTALDLGLGRNQEKERWGGAARPVISLSLGSAGARGHAGIRLYRLARAWQQRRTPAHGRPAAGEVEVNGDGDGED